ncbi:hypothetical protein OIU78_003038 [Salix suchowensis]|nr:hypothetical protein OIU78_003038 [Salix suchowensis]
MMIRNNNNNTNSKSSNGRESLAGGRSIPAGSQYRLRGHNVTGGGGFSKNNNGRDENLDLLSNNRCSLSVSSSDESSDVSVKLGRLSVGSAKFPRSGIDDLLSTTEGGKHDYDWLLTPPGTPLFPSSEGSESKPTSVAPRRSSMARSTSTTKVVSRISVSQSESYHSSRPTRSRSVTRPSISSSQHNTSSSNRSSSILNTSSAFVSSYTRPSSPIIRTPPVARPSTPLARATPSRSSTPSRVRPAPTSSSTDKTRPSQNSRPSTPSSRGQIPANFSAAPTQSDSRPSTPTRRNPAPSSSATSSQTSAGRALSNGHITGPASRPRSPSPRVRPPPQRVIPPDFPLDTPPNLRTLQERPLSAGRSRTGVSSAMKGNPETMGSVNASRRHSSPIVTRGRLTEPSGKGRVHSNGHVADTPEPQKVSHVSEVGMRRPVKSPSAASDSTGFGRTISKKSLDMAIRHMDIRNGTGSARPLSSTTLFPQSIRSSTPKSQYFRSQSTSESINNGNSQNGVVLDNETRFSRAAEIRHEANDGRYSAKLSNVDIYESSRYDGISLEDLKNTNWLHSIDDESDQGPFFDNGSESLPEPFNI